MLIPIPVGSVWKDCDPRIERRVTVVEVSAGFVVVHNASKSAGGKGRLTKVKVGSFHEDKNRKSGFVRVK